MESHVKVHQTNPLAAYHWLHQESTLFFQGCGVQEKKALNLMLNKVRLLFSNRLVFSFNGFNKGIDFVSSLIG